MWSDVVLRLHTSELHEHACAHDYVQLTRLMGLFFHRIMDCSIFVLIQVNLTLIMYVLSTTQKKMSTIFDDPGVKQLIIYFHDPIHILCTLPTMLCRNHPSVSEQWYIFCTVYFQKNYKSSQYNSAIHDNTFLTESFQVSIGALCCFWLNFNGCTDWWDLEVCWSGNLCLGAATFRGSPTICCHTLRTC